MQLMEFIRKELGGWNTGEKIFVPLFLIGILLLSIYMQDSKVATASAFLGLLYTILAGKGKISCFFFGLQGTLCYSFLSWENALYGNLLLYMGYYFPMQIIGIFQWKKNLKKENNEIKKTFLSPKEIIWLTGISIFSIVALSLILKQLNGNAPILDASATILSLAGMYLTVKRCIEQWIIWTIVNSIMVIIWLNIFLQGGNTFATLLMWSAYLFLGLYFLYKWAKELKQENQN